MRECTDSIKLKRELRTMYLSGWGLEIIGVAALFVFGSTQGSSNN